MPKLDICRPDNYPIRMAKFDIFTGSQKLMSMNETTWARHANPLSVYSRIVGGTLVFLALWSPSWFGYWGIPVILAAALWIWLNPRLFPPPKSSDTWATQGVLGERAFVNRKQIPIPKNHQFAAYVTSGIAGFFLLIVVVAFIQRDFWLAFVAWHSSTVAKLWFCDRMAWLWTDMRSATEQYRAWDEAKW